MILQNCKKIVYQRKQQILENHNNTSTEVASSHAIFTKNTSVIVHRNVNNDKVSQELTHTIKIASSAPVKPHVFAVPINEQSKTPNGVPVVVEACLQFFKTKAMDCEGLFRVPGDQRRVDELWDYMQKHPYAG